MPSDHPQSTVQRPATGRLSLAAWVALAGVLAFGAAFVWLGAYLGTLARAEQAQEGGEFGARYTDLSVPCPMALAARDETMTFTLGYDNQSGEGIAFPIEVRGGAFRIEPPDPQIVALAPGESTTLEWALTPLAHGTLDVTVQVVDSGRVCRVEVKRVLGLEPNSANRTRLIALAVMGPLLALPWLWGRATRAGVRRVWLWLVIRYGIWFLGTLLGWGAVTMIMRG